MNGILTGLLGGGVLAISIVLSVVLYMMSSKDADDKIETMKTERQIKSDMHQKQLGAVMNGDAFPVDSEIAARIKANKEKLAEYESRRKESQRIQDQLAKEGLDVINSKNKDVPNTNSEVVK